MTALAEVFVTVKPDVDKFGPEVKKKLRSIDTKKEGSAVAGRFGVGFNGAFGGIVKKSAGLFVGAFAAIQGVKIFGGFIKDAAESARVSRLTAAAIKSTGGAAKITASQVGDLATAISNKTGADDETIQSGANLLLTFTGVRNELGKGNDIFNQATQTVTDMAAALNGGEVSASGVKSASIQLGKALNDPIKGVSALSKVGVTFTADQKKQIETLVKSGKTMEAQKVILGELKKEFGGAAAAAADPFTRLQTIFGNLGEELGGYLLPYAEKFANFVSTRLIPGVSGLVAVLVKGDVTSAFTKALGISEDSGLVTFLLGVHDAAVKAFGFVRSEALPRLKEFGGFLVGTVVPAVVSFATNLAHSVAPVLQTVFGFFKTEVLPRLQSFASFLGSDVLPKVGQLATAFSKNKDFLVPFVAVLATAVGVIGAISAALKVWAAIQAVVNVVLAANPIGIVVLAIAGLVAGVIYAYKHSQKFREILQGAFKGIQAAAQVFAPLVKAAIDIVIGVFSLWWNYYAKPILSQFKAMLKVVWEAAGVFGRIVSAGFTAIKEPARVAIKFVIDHFLGLVENILTGAAKAFGWVPNLGPKLKAAATEFGKFRDRVNGALSGVQDQQINFTIKYSNTGVNLSTPSSVGRRASGGPGGPVAGPGSTTSDTAGLYALSNKEWVIRAASTMKYGDRAMASVNAGTATIIPDGGFASGGRAGISTRIIGDVAGMAASVRKVVTTAAAAAMKQLAKSGGNLAGTMAFGRAQDGKPYIWGGVGPAGYDCSGFVSALINYARGRNPYRRIGATGSMPWSEFGPGSGRFMVGWFKGNPGHTAATINGVNFESRGGRGVVVGSGARGAGNGLFTHRAAVKGFAGGGKVQGDLPFDLINPRGRNFQGKKFLAALGIDDFDTGGRWKSGTLGVNLSGKTETVIPGDGQLDLSDHSLRRLADLLSRVAVTVDERSFDRGFTRHALNGGFD